MTIARHQHRSIIWWYYLIDITIPKLSLVFTFDASWYHWLSFPLCKRSWLIEKSERLYSSSDKINLLLVANGIRDRKRTNNNTKGVLFKHVESLFQIGACLILFSFLLFCCMISKLKEDGSNPFSSFAFFSYFSTFRWLYNPPKKKNKKPPVLECMLCTFIWRFHFIFKCPILYNLY